MEKKDILKYGTSVLALTAVLPESVAVGVAIRLLGIGSHIVIDKVASGGSFDDKVNKQLEDAVNSAKKAAVAQMQSSERGQALIWHVNEEFISKTADTSKAFERALRRLYEEPTQDEQEKAARVFEECLEEEIAKHGDLSRVVTVNRLSDISCTLDSYGAMLRKHDDDIFSLYEKLTDFDFDGRFNVFGEKLDGIEAGIGEIVAGVDVLLKNLQPGGIGKNDSDIPHYLTHQPTPVGWEFSHREDTVNQLLQNVRQNIKTVLINGLGGIGKTTVARELFHKIKGEFKHIAWVEYQNNVRESLLNSFTIYDDVSETDERYRRITNFLKDATKDTIIFVDNVADDKGGVAFLEQLDANVILTSRMPKLGGFKKFPIGFLSEEQCIDIFYKYYEYDDNRKNEDTVRKLVQMVRNHTLSVELLARAANTPEYTLEEFLAGLKEKGFEYTDLDIDTSHNANSQTIAGHLCGLYELVTENEDEKRILINDEQKRILKNFSVMPSVEIPGKVREWLGCSVNDIKGLVKLGWLAESASGYEMHPIVKDAILLQYKGVRYEDFEAIIGYMSGDGYIKEDDVYTEVHPRLDIAEAVMRRFCGFENIGIGLLLNNLAKVYYYHGYYLTALEWYQRERKIREKLWGLDHPSTAAAYNSIALVYTRQGDYANAIEWFQKALVICEKMLGVDHPSTGTVYDNIASVNASEGEYSKALKGYKKALVICEKVLGIDHPSTATTYNNIALVYSRQGEYVKAQDMNQKALVIREKMLGLEHPDTAITYHNMACVYCGQGDNVKALEWFQKALAIREKVLGPEHPDTIATIESIKIITNSKN